MMGREDRSSELPVCDRCGEENNPERVYGEVDICRMCFASAEWMVDQLKLILQKFIDGGRLESLLVQCEAVGVRPTDRMTAAGSGKDTDK